MDTQQHPTTPATQSHIRNIVNNYKLIQKNKRFLNQWINSNIQQQSQQQQQRKTKRKTKTNETNKIRKTV